MAAQTAGARPGGPQFECVGERGALAGVPVPGLESLRRRRIGDDPFDTGADLVHLGGVSHLVGCFEAGAAGRTAEARQKLLEETRRRRPPVGDEVVFGTLPGDDAQEVVAALTRPARAVGADVLGGGTSVRAHVHAGGGALEDVEVARVLGQLRDDLDPGGARAHDTDVLVRQPGQPAVRGAARVAVVPARGVEGVAPERLDARDAGTPSTRDRFASSAAAACSTSRTFSSSTALATASRSGKCRYRTPWPTPARRAIADSGASRPCSE